MSKKILLLSAQAFLVPFCLILTVVLTEAATADVAADESARIIQQQKEQLDALESDFQKRKDPAPELPEWHSPVYESVKETGRCNDIESIDVEGVAAFSEKEITREISEQYSGRCLSLKEINSILRAITVKYFDAGYITSRAYIKPQDLSNGHLLITVIEGKIAQIRFKDHRDVAMIRAAFPIRPGDILNLRALEQGLDQLNRLKSNKVRLQLLPGDVPGSTDILLENDLSARPHLSVSLDNNGSENTGVVQAHAAFGYDNGLGIADYFSAMVSQDLHFDPDKKSRNFNVRYQVPWGWNRFELNYGHFDYGYPITGATQTFAASGASRSLSMSAERVMFRNQRTVFKSGLELNWKDEKNYLLDVLLDSSSQHFVVARGFVNVEQSLPATVFSFGLGYHRGINILDAQDDNQSPPGAPQAQFEKWTTDLAVTAGLFKVPWMKYRLSISGLYSADHLFASEQISIGSLYSVRGFKQDGYAGNRGGYIRNEIAFPLASGKLMQKLGVDWIEPYAGFDWGSVDVVGNDDRDGYENLQSWTIGFDSGSSRQTVRLSYSRPIDKPASFAESEGEFLFSLNRYF